jgi:serine/threonine protein kinase
LKPGNILIDENKCLKISDFGLARKFGSPGRNMSHQAVTRWYRSPELLFGAKKYGEAVDMWSIGCIFAEMMQREPYLQGETDIGQLNTIFCKLGTPTEEDWPEMKFLPDYFTVPARPAPSMKKTFPEITDDATALLKRLLCFDPQKRISAAAAKRDPYFSLMPEATPQAELPMPLPKGEGKDTGSGDRGSMFNIYGMGPPRALCMESPVAPLHFPTPEMGERPGGMVSEGSLGRPQALHFPTPDGAARELNSLNSSFESQEGNMAKGTPASFDTCGMPKHPRRDRVDMGMDSSERVKIRKRKLDMDQALEDAASEDPSIALACASPCFMVESPLEALPVNAMSGGGAPAGGAVSFGAQY